MSCSVPPIIKHLKAFCWHLYKKNRWVCCIWFWSQFDADLNNCPQQKEFCRLFLQKEMTEFWYQECWQIAESAAHLSLDWQFNHWKCTTRLDSKEQRRRNYSFWGIKRLIKIRNANTFWGVTLLHDLHAIFSVVVSRNYRFSFSFWKCWLIHCINGAT